LNVLKASAERKCRRAEGAQKGCYKDRAEGFFLRGFPPGRIFFSEVFTEGGFFQRGLFRDGFFYATTLTRGDFFSHNFNELGFFTQRVLRDWFFYRTSFAGLRNYVNHITTQVGKRKAPANRGKRRRGYISVTVGKSIHRFSSASSQSLCSSQADLVLFLS